MLDNYYVSIDVYRTTTTTDNWGNQKRDGHWVKQGSIQGFLQERGSDYRFVNQAINPTSTHILYTNIGVDILKGDRIYVNSLYYRVEDVQPVGISSVGHHQEIPCTLLGDI